MHLTDEQLNEYLDHEAADRAQVEMHLATCSDCSARLSALQALFSEIESLPELALSPDFSIEYKPSQPIQLPPSLTLTMIVQAAFAAAGIVLGAPFAIRFASSYTPEVSAPSLVDVLLQLQNQWRIWLDVLSTFQLPAIPEIPVVNVSNLIMIGIVIGVSLLWLVGNGLLLRNQMK